MPLDWLVNCLYANIFRFVGASVDRSAHQSPIVGVSNLWNFSWKNYLFCFFLLFFCICCPSSCNWKVVLTIRIGWTLSLFCFFWLFCPFWKRIFAFLLLFFVLFFFFFAFFCFFCFFFFFFFLFFFFSFFAFVLRFCVFFAFFCFFVSRFFFVLCFFWRLFFAFFLGWGLSL